MNELKSPQQVTMSSPGPGKFCKCKCYFINNYYSNIARGHFRFIDRTQFNDDYKKFIEETFHGDIDLLLKELEDEQQRRYSLSDISRQRTLMIAQQYQPLHPQVYTLKEEYLALEFLDIVRCSRSDSTTASDLIMKMHTWKAEKVYGFPVFTTSFCGQLLEELEHFLDSGLPAGKPNTMNKYGILLNELGFDDEFITPLREQYIQPLAAILFPEWTGTQLDSHKAFTVQYELDGDRSLDYHYDNAEVTMNVCLGKGFDDGMLFFGKMRTESQTSADWSEVTHKVSHGVFHRGQHKHGAMPVEDGVRVNLIIWCRSSKVRNQLCPMCDATPDLLAADDFGDGFNRETVEICNVV